MRVAPRQATRRSKRITLVRPCRYELTESPDAAGIMLHQGYALSSNVSTTGMLLLMPHTPEIRQVFEVHVPPLNGKKEAKLTLVEVRWIREIPVESGNHMCLTGVKFLVQPRRASEKQTSA